MAKPNQKPDDKHNPNKDICDMLLELGEYERNVNRNIYKYNAYRKASTSLSTNSKRIASGDEAKKLPGIGAKIAEKIDEYLKTGTIEKLKTVRQSDKSSSISELCRVSGIGPAVAKKLYDEGITSIDDLRKHENRLTHHQNIGLKYLTEFETKIPRKEIEEIEEMVDEEAMKIDRNLIITICGSYRRGAKQSGDIDILVSHSMLKSDKIKANKKITYLSDLVERLEDCGLISDRLSLGDTKFMGVCQLKNSLPHRRIDIRFLPIDQYYCGILYFTGSDLFNQRMRQHANENGFTLNEYSLRKLGSTGVPGEPIRIASERDIFEYIDYPYKKPSDRNV